MQTPATWPFGSSPLPRALPTDSITMLPNSCVYGCVCIFFVCFRENRRGGQFSLLSAAKYNQYISQAEAIDQRVSFWSHIDGLSCKMSWKAKISGCVFVIPDWYLSSSSSSHLINYPVHSGALPSGLWLIRTVWDDVWDCKFRGFELSDYHIFTWVSNSHLKINPAKTIALYHRSPPQTCFSLLSVITVNATP